MKGLELICQVIGFWKRLLRVTPVAVIGSRDLLTSCFALYMLDAAHLGRFWEMWVESEIALS